VFDLALLETGTDAAALVDDGVAVDEGVVGSRALRLGAMMRSQLCLFPVLCIVGFGCLLQLKLSVLLSSAVSGLEATKRIPGLAGVGVARWKVPREADHEFNAWRQDFLRRRQDFVRTLIHSQYTKSHPKYLQ
jgi:hypothetical protein